jgi:hypothetical protein
MDISTDYGTMETIIMFTKDENPMDGVPQGWVVIERTEPEEFRGMINPGRLVCRLPRVEIKIIKK